MRIVLILAAIAAAIGGGYWYWQSDDGAAAGAAPGGGGGGGGGGMPVEAAVIEAESLSRTAVAIGTLRSSESVVISSEIAGRIVEIGFDEGQAIEAGALLFRLDDSILKAERNQARANLTLARRNHERAQELHRKDLASARERDEAAANLEVAQATLELAEARLEKATLRAPFAGITGLRQVSPGDYVTAGTALVNLEAIDTLKVDFRVAEKALPALATGQQLTLEVDAWPGEQFTAEVYAIDPRVDVANRSVGLRARLPNPDAKLRPGLFAKVTLAFDTVPDAVLIPEQAVMPRGEQSFVYVIEDGKAAIRPVKLGQRRAGRVQVLEGVADGETIVTAGWQKIGPGSAVMPINLKPLAGADTTGEG